MNVAGVASGAASITLSLIIAFPHQGPWRLKRGLEIGDPGDGSLITGSALLIGVLLEACYEADFSNTLAILCEGLCFRRLEM